VTKVKKNLDGKYMSKKEKRHIGIRILASVSSLVIIVSITFMLIAGANLTSSLILISALGGIAGPAIVAGDGFLNIIDGFFEIFFEGILSIFEGIAEIFGSIFN